MSDQRLYFQYLDSPLGEIELTSNSIHLLSVLFVKNGKQILEKQPVAFSAINEKAKEQLQAYFDKKLTVFDLPLSPPGTDFQKSVWKELQKIPFGQTISYLTLSKMIGDPDAIRAAAAANGKNPIVIIIPCHRVIGSDGKLVGYSGELWRKKWLLDHESNQEKLF